MEIEKMTCKVVAKNNPYAQKRITVTVPKNSKAFNVFEEKAKQKLGNNIEFNHAGKVVICN